MIDRPNHVSHCFVDADIVSYRAAFATENEPPWETERVIDDLMGWIIQQTVVFTTEENFKGYLTGKDNFRYNVAKTHPYKGNRRDVSKPTHLPHARAYLEQEWGCTIVNGAEADDAIAMATVGKDPEVTVIASIDKDFKTVPCWLYNFTKNTWLYSDQWDAAKYFYSQILSGDSADNIKGLHRVGEKTAYKMLADCETEKNLYEVTLSAYEEKCTDGDPEGRLLENARLLHLQRYKGEVWRPPE